MVSTISELESAEPDSIEKVHEHFGPIRLLDSSVLRGQNVYHRSTVFRQSIDFGALAGLSTGEAGPGFAAGFIERFLRLDVTAAAGICDDFRRRLEQPDGVPFDEALFRAALSVEAFAAFSMGRLDSLAYREMFSAEQPGVTDMVWSCSVPRLSRLAVAAACTGVAELLPEELQSDRGLRVSATFERQLQKLRRIAARRQLSLDAEVLAQAARRKGLPCDFVGNAYLRLGEGFAQHIIHASFRGHRPAEESIVTDPMAEDIEIPEPARLAATDIDAARAAAIEIGFPVVLRPERGGHTPGAAIHARCPEDLAGAYATARREGDSVVVEQLPEGRTHRLLIVDGRLVAACRLEPPALITDGQQSIRELIDALNRDPKRNGVWLSKIVIDEPMQLLLSRAGFSVDDVPEAGLLIYLNSIVDHSAGASSIDVTDHVHDDNRQIAIAAVQRAGLPVATVELVTTDIAHSWRTTAGRIVGVSPRAELALHAWPRYGKPRRVGEAILDLAFPEQWSGRVPILLVTGERGRGRVAKRLEKLLRRAGVAVGRAGRKLATIAGQPVRPDSARLDDATRFLLQDPRVEAAIGETSARRVVERGMRIERCDALAIVDPAPPRKETQYRQALSVLLSATTGFAVIDVANDLAVELTAEIAQPRVLLLSMQPDHPRVREHLAAGGCAIVAPGGKERLVELKRGDQTIVSIPCTALLDAGESRPAKRAVRDAMCALALAFGAGLTPEELRSALLRHADENSH